MKACAIRTESVETSRSGVLAGFGGPARGRAPSSVALPRAGGSPGGSSRSRADHPKHKARLDDATIRELEEHFVSADIDADGGLDMDEAVIMLDMFLSALGTDSAREEDRGEWINFERIFRDLHLGDYDDDDDEALDLDESPDGRSESESYGKVGHGVGSGIVDRGEVLGVADEKMVEDFDSDDSGILDLDEDDDLLIFGDDDDVCILDFDNDDLGILDFDSEPQDAGRSGRPGEIP